MRPDVTKRRRSYGGIESNQGPDWLREAAVAVRDERGHGRARLAGDLEVEVEPSPLGSTNEVVRSGSRCSASAMLRLVPGLRDDLQLRSLLDRLHAQSLAQEGDIRAYFAEQGSA